MSTENEPNPANCPEPIDPAILADYWLAALPAKDEEAVELHLLECDACGARLREVIALAHALRSLARAGSLRLVVSDAFLERAARDGLRVHKYELSPGAAVQCTVTAEDDLLVGRLAATFTGAKRVDLYFRDNQGIERARLRDIPLHPNASHVAYQESITLARDMPTHTMTARLVAIDDAGSERILGEYTFNHTRTLPGPGAS